MSAQLAERRINISANDEYVAWFEDVAERSGMSKSQFAAVAIQEYAAARGFSPPPRRTAPVGRRRKGIAGPQGDA